MKKIRFLFFLALLLMTAVGAKADGLVVTSNDIGKVICTDGSLYATVSAAGYAGKTPVAMIAYIDTQNHTGLAIALEDAVVNMYAGCEWSEIDTHVQTWVSNNVYTVANATWKVPTATEWQQMLIGCGANGSVSDDLPNVSLSYVGINTLLGNNAYETSQLVTQWPESYWTTTEDNESKAWYAAFSNTYNNMFFVSGEKTNAYTVRPCLSFDVAEPIRITAADAQIGWVICTDGTVVASAAAATAASKTAAAMIASVDTENGKGLAIALNDAKESGIIPSGPHQGEPYKNTSWDWTTAKGMATAYTPAVNGAVWKLPTIDEWEQMLIDCGGTRQSDDSEAEGYHQISYAGLDNKLCDIGGYESQLQSSWTNNDNDYYNYYWSATEGELIGEEESAKCLYFWHDLVDIAFCNESKVTSYYYGHVRACFDFILDVPVVTTGIVATTNDIGRVLCTDGSIYATVSAATEASKTPAAMITYVNTDSKQGIAIALADESDGTWGWSYSSQMAAAHTPTVTNGTWKMPTVLEWQQMLIGCGATGTADGSVGPANSISYSEMNAKLNAATGTTMTTSSNYWTATEDSYDSDDAYVLQFNDDMAYFGPLYKGNSNGARARACLTFDIADAPEPELLSLNVTTAHVGKVVCTDGSIYDSVAEAEADDKTPAGMIAFVDMEYETGLAIALHDEREYNEQYNYYYSSSLNWSTASTAAAAHEPAVPGTTWRLPTIDEWRNMLVGCGAYIEYVNDNTTTYAEINNALYNAGASTLDESYISTYDSNRYGFGQYWSSTVKEFENNQYASYAEFKDDEANLSYSTDLYQQKYVRACFPFNVTLTKYPITIYPYYASYITSKSEAAEGETVGVTVTNIPEGKYVNMVYITKTDNGDWVDGASQSIYNENEYFFTMPAYPVTVNVYFEDIQEAQVIDGLYYTLNNQYGTAEVASHPDNGYSGAITVPATVKPSDQTYYVTSIGQDAFAGYNNNEITSVTLGSNVRTIRRDAFYNTALTSLTLNEGLTNIEQYAFRNGDYPIAIPSTVSYISTWSFKGYKGTSMSVAAGNGKYDSRGGCNAIIETATNTIVAGCRNSTIPSTVTIIGLAAFDSVGLETITIPATVTTIEHGAFANNLITSVNIPATVTEIDNNPFYGCNQLASITVDPNNSKFDSRNGCNAICDKTRRWIIATCKNSVIPADITGIGTYAFAYREDLNEFKVPSNISLINDNAFAYSNLWNITLADNNDLIIGRWAFAQCKELRTVKMGRGINRIDEQVLIGCPKLSNIYVNAPLIPKVKNITFEVDDAGNFTTAKVHVPSASLATYQKANFWKNLNLVGSNSVQGVTATFESVNNDKECSAEKELITEEGTIWDCSASSATTTTYSSEKCLEVSSSPVTLSNCSTNGFIINGSVKRIVVRAANVTGITCEIVDISADANNTTADQTNSEPTISGTSTFKDYSYDFTGEEYTKAKVKVTITGTSPIYVQSISIVQGGGDYVITDESSTTVQGVEYSNTMSAPANAQDAEAIIDNVPVYVYTTCLPTAPVRDTGLKFYTLSSSTNTSLQFAEVTGALAANTPYLVAVSQDAEIGMSVENESVTLKKESDNYSLSSDGAYKFVGTTTGLTNAEAVAASAYILQDGNVWGQVTAENFEAYIPPFRAYIVPTGPSSRSMLSGGFTDATGIKSLQLTDRDGTKHYFDLNGRRISSPAASGVYVTNGKKVIIKK